MNLKEDVFVSEWVASEPAQQLNRIESDSEPQTASETVFVNNAESEEVVNVAIDYIQELAGLGR